MHPRCRQVTVILISQHLTPLPAHGAHRVVVTLIRRRLVPRPMESVPLPACSRMEKMGQHSNHRSGRAMANEVTGDAAATKSRRRLLTGTALGVAAFAAAEVARPPAARADVLIGRFRGTVVDNN